MSNQDKLVKKIRELLMHTVDQAIRVLVDNGYRELVEPTSMEKANKIRTSYGTIYNEVIGKLIDAIEDAGYTNKAPTGDLRVQLTAVAHQLKACSFSRGYSGDGTVDSDAVNEAKAEVKAKIGEMLLEALTS